MKYLLMIPGPVEIPDDILVSFQGQPVAHYGPEWAELYLETAGRISKIIGSKGRTFLMPGSGSLGLDTAAATFCRSKRCLVLNNGMFGERLYNIVSKHTPDVEVLKFPLNIPVDQDIVNKTLKDKNFDAVFMTQVETSTGILNPVEEISKISKENGALFILDAISSAAIERLEMDNWGVDITVTASQKGFECPAGLGIVTVKLSLLDSLRDSPGHTWYTDLRVWCDYYDMWHDWHPFPVTLPTNTIMALAKSSQIIETEGISSRQKMHKEISSRFRKAISELGLKLYAKENQCAHGLTAVSTDGKFEPSELIIFLKKKLGIQISGSFGEIKNHVFRIGHMSRKQCLNVNFISLLNGIAFFMKKSGINASIEKAIDALIE